MSTSDTAIGRLAAENIRLEASLRASRAEVESAERLAAAHAVVLAERDRLKAVADAAHSLVTHYKMGGTLAEALRNAGYSLDGDST